MNPIDGRVQSLNMRAPDAATWQRVATLVEEAIKSAALDAELPGRLFVVRQLDVGTIARAAPPQSLALAIESAVERVTSQAVSADDPTAGVAPMVYFKDDASVILSLAQRVASTKPTTEWFWPSVVKGWTPNTPVDRAITLLIERAMPTSGGVVTVAQVVDTLASSGVLDKLLERLSPTDGRALLETIGWTEAMVRAAGVSGAHTDGLTPRLPPIAHMPPAPEILHLPQSPETPEPQKPPVTQMPARAESLVQRWVGRWDDDARDPRAVWLGAMLLVADRPARSTSAELPEMVRRWLELVVQQAQSSVDGDIRNDVAAQSMRRDDLIADARAWLQSNPRSPLDSLFGGGPQRPLIPADLPLDPKAVERHRPDDETPPLYASPEESPAWKTPRPSHHAGFLFVIPVLTRTGLTNIVATDPALIERDWTTALLLRLARHLGISFDDPAVAWTAARPATITHADRSLTAEVMRAARIRCRMEVGLTMRQVVHRAGAIVASRTAVDVFLHHTDVDSKLRSAGLDADADFVPWLGSTLQFHYLDALDVNV